MMTYLDAEVSSIDIISQEEVSCIGRATAHFEQFHQVILRGGLQITSARMTRRIRIGRGYLHKLRKIRAPFMIAVR